MTGMDWQRLAQAIVDRRVELGFKTREALLAQDEVDLSRRVLSDLEKGRRDNYDQGTLSRLERALEWPKGAVYRILRGQGDTADGSDPADINSLAWLARELHRDNLPLLALIQHAGLDEASRFRIVLHVRERWRAEERALLEDVAAAIVAAGGRVPGQVWPPVWLTEE
jgi:hypothetical protein